MVTNRYPIEVRAAIWDRYVPRDAKGAPEKGVLYVGPLLDGLASFMPEIFAGDRQNSARQRIKRFVHDLINPRTGRREGAGWLYATLKFSRSNKQLVLSAATLRNEEPGEMINSVVVEAVGGVKRLVNPTTRQETEPTIRIHAGADLHYLKTGDTFDLEWTTQRGHHFQYKYVLRPASEGSSLVTLESAESPVTVL